MFLQLWCSGSICKEFKENTSLNIHFKFSLKIYYFTLKIHTILFQLICHQMKFRLVPIILWNIVQSTDIFHKRYGVHLIKISKCTISQKQDNLTLIHNITPQLINQTEPRILSKLLGQNALCTKRQSDTTTIVHIEVQL